MKFFPISLFAIVALSVQVLAQGPALGPTSVKLGKISPAMVHTPEFQVTGAPPKRSKSREWLEVEVAYGTAPEDIDELTFKFTISIEKKLLDGEVTYVNIPKDREHYAVMYVSPRALEKLTGGKPLNASSIENVWVEISHSGQVLARDSAKPGQMPNLPHVSGLVLTKSDTPFAPLYYDRYESVKSTGSR